MNTNGQGLSLRVGYFILKYKKGQKGCK